MLREGSSDVFACILPAPRGKFNKRNSDTMHRSGGLPVRSSNSSFMARSMCVPFLLVACTELFEGLVLLAISFVCHGKVFSFRLTTAKPVSLVLQSHAAAFATQKKRSALWPLGP